MISMGLCKPETQSGPSCVEQATEPGTHSLLLLPLLGRSPHGPQSMLWPEWLPAGQFLLRTQGLTHLPVQGPQRVCPTFPHQILRMVLLCCGVGIGRGKREKAQQCKNTAKKGKVWQDSGALRSRRPSPFADEGRGQEARRRNGIGFCNFQAGAWPVAPQIPGQPPIQHPSPASGHKGSEQPAG